MPSVQCLTWQAGWPGGGMSVGEQEPDCCLMPGALSLPSLRLCNVIKGASLVSETLQMFRTPEWLPWPRPLDSEPLCWYPSLSFPLFQCHHFFFPSYKHTLIPHPVNSLRTLEELIPFKIEIWDSAVPRRCLQLRAIACFFLSWLPGRSEPTATQSQRVCVPAVSSSSPLHSLNLIVY